jgi:tetratricopeptide (TPR) repeat protein
MRRNQVLWAVTALLVSVSPASAWAADARSEYGVSLAMSGEEARAESLFITMLSHTRGDARALNNLGNIRLLRGETGVALAFYERALRGDSLDAGIHLNRATALLVIGDRERSERAFARGVKLAGGVEQAQALLGMPPEKQPNERAAKKTVIDPEQVRAMLKQAASSVPTETVKSGTAGAGRTATGKTPSAWRSAGARASDGSETSRLLYWKH